VLSAKFGLISADQPISNYDQRMTRERANLLQVEVVNKLHQILRSLQPSNVYVNLGKDYQEAVDGFLRSAGADPLVLATGGQGIRLRLLRRWLYHVI
jgi:hypothetical protein